MKTVVRKSKETKYFCASWNIQRIETDFLFPIFATVISPYKRKRITTVLALGSSMLSLILLFSLVCLVLSCLWAPNDCFL